MPIAQHWAAFWLTTSSVCWIMVQSDLDTPIWRCRHFWCCWRSNRQRAGSFWFCVRAAGVRCSRTWRWCRPSRLFCMCQISRRLSMCWPYSRKVMFSTSRSSCQSTRNFMDTGKWTILTFVLFLNGFGSETKKSMSLKAIHRHQKAQWADRYDPADGPGVPCHQIPVKIGGGRMSGCGYLCTVTRSWWIAIEFIRCAFQWFVLKPNWRRKTSKCKVG